LILAACSYRELHERGAEWLDNHKRDCLILAASRHAAFDFLRAKGQPGHLGIHALTLTQAAAQLAATQLAGRGLRPTSQLSLEALAARVVYQLRELGKIEYFEPVADTPGFVRALSATLSELRMEQVEPADLARAGAPGRDLARLLEAYAERLIDDRLADHANLYAFATKAVHEGTNPLIGLPLLLLDLPVRFARQRQFVEALAKHAPSTLALTLAADEESLRGLEETLGETAEVVLRRDQSTIGRVRQYLFAPHVPVADASDDTVEVFSAPGEGLECVEIARRIRKAAAGGLPFDRIAVLLRAPERYQPLLEEALRRASIPAYFQRGTARPDLAGRAFLALLACASEGCSASRFAEYLSLAQVPELDSSGAPVRKERGYAATADEVLSVLQPQSSEVEAGPEDAPALAAPATWERLLVDAAVIGGRERWARRLAGLDNEIRLQLASAKIEEESTRLRLERRLEHLHALQGFALPMIEQLSALPKQAKWGVWIDALTALAETALRYPDSVLSVLNELRPMSDVGPVGLDEVGTVLRDRMRFLRPPPVGRRYGCVYVATIEEARANHFDLVFLPGLAEGVFPRRTQEDPLLLDTWRERVAGRLIRQETRVARERLLLRLAAAVAERLVVSFPSVDVSLSRPRVPSFYALEVSRACEGRFPKLSDFARRAASSTAARLGWPAPADPADAIDDTEFDLATLQRVAAIDPAEARSSARYLVDVNPHLGRALRARWRRWEQAAWSSNDGLVNPDAATLEILSSHKLKTHPFSATALQHYAACPYRFLLHSIHQLRPREEVEAIEQLDPLTRGALFHEAQFRLMTEARAQGILPVTRQNLRSALDLLDSVLDDSVRKWEEELAPAIGRVWSNEIEDLRTDLRGWLRELAAGDWLPLHFELAFGTQAARQRDPSSSDAPVLVAEQALLRGAIDLVEKHSIQQQVRVTDNKTGKAPENVPVYIGGGTHLQPLLYALAVEQLLGTPVFCGRLFYCTQRGTYREIEIPVTNSARQHIAHVLETIDRAISAGFLPSAPVEDACRRCDYRLVCGPYEGQRQRKKSREPLEALIELRGLP